jgi:hypothetical protein
MLLAFVSSVSNVSKVCCNCFIRMLQKYIRMLHMLQWLYTCVASSCSQCFIYFFRRMLQVCFIWMFHMFSCIWCKCFIWRLRMFIMVSSVFQVFLQVFRRMFQCFICFQTYVAIIVSGCFKTRSGAVSPRLSAVLYRCQSWEASTGGGSLH